jgi:hypothetical protein
MFSSFCRLSPSPSTVSKVLPANPFNIPPELAEERSWIWADMTSGSFRYYGNKTGLFNAEEFFQGLDHYGERHCNALRKGQMPERLKRIDADVAKWARRISPIADSMAVDGVRGELPSVNP